MLNNKERDFFVQVILNGFEQGKDHCPECLKGTGVTTCPSREVALLLKSIQRSSGPRSNERIDVVLAFYLSVKENRLQIEEALGLTQVSLLADENLSKQLVNARAMADVKIPREEFAQQVLEKRAEWGLAPDQDEVVNGLLKNKARKVPLLCLIGQLLAIRDAMVAIEKIAEQSALIQAELAEEESKEAKAAARLGQQIANARWN